MAFNRNLSVTSTGAFVAFILYLYIELSTQIEGGWKYLFLALFLIFSVIALIDALRGGLKDKRIIGQVKVGKKVIRK